MNFTRSRPYYKNDNAHIEQKNWTHIRQFLGYARFEKTELVEMLNDLYENEWRLLFNFFIPYVKLLDKTREGSKTRKIYDQPRTPYQRLKDCPEISDEQKNQLKLQFESLNPVELIETVSLKIKQIQKVALQKS